MDPGCNGSNLKSRLKCALRVRRNREPDSSDQPVIWGRRPGSSLSPPRTLQLPSSPLHTPDIPLMLHPPHPLVVNPSSGPVDLPHWALLAHHSPPHPIVLWVLAPLNPHLHPSCHERPPRVIPEFAQEYLSRPKRVGGVCTAQQAADD